MASNRLWIGRSAFLFVALLCVVQLGTRSSAAAPPVQPTPFLTPTPGPDGRIVYTVQLGDSAWRIAAIAKITLQELYALNGLQSTDFLSPGQQLVLGLAGPVGPTAPPPPAATATAISTTPTPTFGTGEVCVMIYLDENGNTRLDPGEGPLVGGQVSIADTGGVVAGEHTTDDTPEGYCFTDLKNGDYNISAAVPAGYNPTSAMNLPLHLDPGDSGFVEFGAQPSAALGQPGSEGRDQVSTLMGIFGVVLLLAAGGLGFYASRYGKRGPTIGR